MKQSKYEYDLKIDIIESNNFRDDISIGFGYQINTIIYQFPYCCAIAVLEDIPQEEIVLNLFKEVCKQHGYSMIMCTMVSNELDYKTYDFEKISEFKNPETKNNIIVWQLKLI